ncbi:MAG: glycosyltransferase [Planctomycetota bacterium]|nr:glycosyltransferase [Planctomycetota bacterium]
MLAAMDLIQMRPESGGVYTLVRGLVPELLRLHPEHEWHLYYPEDMAPMASPRDGAHLHPLPRHGLPTHLNRAVASLKPDVFFRAFPLDTSNRIPLEKQVVLIPDLQHEILGECFTETDLAWRQKVFRHVQGGAGAIGTLSDHAIETLKRSPWTKCTDLFLMPPGSTPAPPPGALPEAARGKTFFYFPANLWPHKNHAMLLEAFGRFAAARRDPVWLILTGNPQGWPELRARFPGVPALHLGRVPDAQVWALYRNARALSFFSRYEGFGIPLLEAFASDLPVACSNVCSLPEVGGDAVLSCDPGDPQAIAETLARIHEDEALREQLVARGRKRLEAYTWTRSAENLFEALLRVGVTRPVARVEIAGKAPDLTVVIPMLEHRGHLDPCLDSYLNQDCAHERYEIGVVANGRQAALEARAEEKIRGRGWLRRFETANEMELYHRGALMARTPLLLITESHCEAKPETVAGVLRFFEASDLAGGLLHSESRSANEFGSFEGALYEEFLAQARRPGDWHRTGLRGFAVRREILERVGGFDYRYGLFAEQILAATLHARGFPLAFLEGVPIVHHNTATWSELEHSVFNYADGEAAYRDGHARSWCVRMFGAPGQSDARARYGRPQVRAQLDAAARALGAGELRRDERARMLRTLCVWFFDAAPAGLLGLRWLRARLRAQYWATRIRMALQSKPEARLRSFRRGWARLADLGRVRSFLERNPLASPDPPPSTRIEDCEDWQVPGFHPLERHEGRWFRWSGPAAVLRFHARPADAEFALETGPLPCTRRRVLFFNGRRVPAEAIRREPGALCFPVNRDDFVNGPVQELSLVGAPRSRRRSAKKCLPVFGWELRERRTPD